MNTKVSEPEGAGSHLARGKSQRPRTPTLVKPTTSIAAEAQKGLKSIRARRLKSRKHTASKIRAQVAPWRANGGTRNSNDLLDDTGASEGAKPVHSETDPFTALHAKVHELKRSLEAKDKSKRITKIQLSKLKTPNDPVVAPSAQADSIRPLKDTVRQHAGQQAGSASGTSEAPSRGAVPIGSKENLQPMPKAPAKRAIGSDLFRVVSSTAKTTGNSLKSMKPQKDGLVNSIASAKSKVRVSKKADGTLPKSPRRVGSRKDAVIEVVSAEKLDVSGNCSACEHRPRPNNRSGRS